MTREEATEVIKAYKDKLTNSASNQLDGDIEAFDMAIEALEQESCDDAISRKEVLDLAKEECETAIIPYRRFVRSVNDLPSVNPQPDISKDGTLTVHVKDGSKVSRVLVCGDNHWGGLYYPEQEPKTGHWILAGIQSEEDIDNDNYRYICSECQHSDIHDKNIEVPYCWNCGAKMEGEKKE